MLSIHLYIERSFIWCDECLQKESIQKMISQRPLYEVKVDKTSYYGQVACGSCGKREEN